MVWMLCKWNEEVSITNCDECVLIVIAICESSPPSTYLYVYYYYLCITEWYIWQDDI